MREYTVADACARAEISARQLDHWIRRGYLHVDARGSGHQRHLTSDELDVLLVLARLVRAGFRWEQAAQIAREACECGVTEFRLPGGLHVHLIEGAL